MDFGKVITAMVTPFDEDLKVDFKALENLIEHLLENGTDTLLVAGTTGESPTLTDEEKLELFKTTKTIVGNRAKIMAGTGSNNTQHSIELSRKAEKLGVDGLLLVAPYYNKPTQEGLYQHFKSIALAVDIPVVPYHVPGRTSVSLEPETLAQLSNIPNVIAVKDAGGNLDNTSKIRALAPDLVIYSGDDSLTLPMLALGCKGVISVASHIVGKDIKAMIDNFEKGKIQRAQQIHLQLLDMFRGLFVITNPIPVKAALNEMGVKVGGLRLPLNNADENTLAIIKRLLKRYKLI